MIILHIIYLIFESFLQCTCFFIVHCHEETWSQSIYNNKHCTDAELFSLGTIHLNHFRYFFLSISPSSFSFNLLLCSLHPLSPLSSLFHSLVLALSLSFSLWFSQEPNWPNSPPKTWLHSHGRAMLFLTLASSVSQIYLTLCKNNIFFYFISCSRSMQCPH